MVLLQQNSMELSRAVSYLLILASILAIIYVGATTLVVAVPREFPFGIIRVLPSQYWIALGLSLSSLLFALFTRLTRHICISGLLLALVVAGLGDLIYAYPRDLFSIAAAERISMTGVFTPAESPFLNFPGSAILFSFLVLVIGATPALIVKAFGLLYDPILLGLSFLTFRRLGISEKQAILGALVVVFAFYMQGVLVYTSLLGFIFYVAFFGLVLAPYSKLRAQVFLLAAFFGAMVVSHAFTPFLTLGAAIVMLLGWRFADSALKMLRLERAPGDPPTTDRSVLILLTLLLVGYWAYFAADPFAWGLVKLESTDLVSIFRGAGSSILMARTAYQSSYARITELYAPILFLAFAIYLFTSRDSRKLQLSLWILGLAACLVVAVGGYTQEFPARIFALAILPLGYGVARLLQSNRLTLRTIGLGVLLITLSLHLPGHYGQDSFMNVQVSTIQGLAFFAEHSSPHSSIRSRLGELEQEYYFAPHRVGSASLSTPGIYFISNYQVESRVLYSEGDVAARQLTQELNSSQYDRVYSSGWFEVFSRNEH